LATWEIINKGLSLNQLGLRRDAIKEYLRALESDPQAGERFLPINLAGVREQFCPQDRRGKLIIHILSLFSNYKAQKNLAAALDQLVSRYGFRVICLEGGSGRIDLDFYRNLPDEQRKATLADYFVKEGRIQGYEYFAINTKHDIALYGADEPCLHERHSEIHLEGLKERDTWQRHCESLRQALLTLKSHLYNAELKMFEHQKEILESWAYYPFIKSLADQLSPKVPLPNIDKICELIVLGNQMKSNPEALNHEQDELLLFLKENLGAGLKEGLHQVIYEFNQKIITDYQFYRYLREIAVQQFSPTILQKYPNFALAMERQILFGKIDMHQFFGGREAGRARCQRTFLHPGGPAYFRSDALSY